MGTLFYVACHTCGVYRDLDKGMGAAIHTPKTREEALDYAEEVGGNPFRFGLLVSFLLDHNGHKCDILTDDNTAEWDDVLRPEAVCFWIPASGETL